MATAIDTREVGPECTKRGIKFSMLFNDHLSKVQDVTNGLILELASFKDKHRDCTFNRFYKWVQDLFGTDWPEQAPNQQAIKQSIKRLSARLSKTQKAACFNTRQRSKD